MATTTSGVATRPAPAPRSRAMTAATRAGGGWPPGLLPPPPGWRRWSEDRRGQPEAQRCQGGQVHPWNGAWERDAHGQAVGGHRTAVTGQSRDRERCQDAGDKEHRQRPPPGGESYPKASGRSRKTASWILGTSVSSNHATTDATSPMTADRARSLRYGASHDRPDVGVILEVLAHGAPSGFAAPDEASSTRYATRPARAMSSLATCGVPARRHGLRDGPDHPGRVGPSSGTRERQPWRTACSPGSRRRTEPRGRRQPSGVVLGTLASRRITQSITASA